MKLDARTETQGTEAEADAAVTADLRLRLHGKNGQLRLARAEARRLARELALARRLLRFHGGSPPSPVRLTVMSQASARSATLLTEEVRYHLDSCVTRSASTVITGWAFRSAPDWDARATAVTLLFRYGSSAYQAPAGRVARPDVAAHFAAAGEGAAGGARGLDGAGFTCEILHESLPAGVDWEISLRLESGGRACEQWTDRRLRH